MAFDDFEIDDRRAETHVAAGTKPYLRLPNGLEMFKSKTPGVHVFEFIPFRVTERHTKYAEALRFSAPGKWYVERSFMVHQDIGPDNGRYVCSASTYGTPCPICDERSRLSNTGHKPDRDAAYALRPKERQLFLVMERDPRTDQLLPGLPKLWDEAYFNFGKQLDAFIENARPAVRESYKRYYHPRDGFTIRATCAEVSMGKDGGGGKNYPYSINEFYPRPSPSPESVFQHGFDLDVIPREMDFDTLRNIFHGRTDAGEDDRGDDRRETAPTSPPPPAYSPPPSQSRAATSPPPAPPVAPPPPPPPPPPPLPAPHKWADGDLVVIREYRGERTPGRIATNGVNNDKGILGVIVAGREKPVWVDFDEVEFTGTDDDVFDLPTGEPTSPSPAPPVVPPPPPAKSGGRKWDDDDAPPSRTKRGK